MKALMMILCIIVVALVAVGIMAYQRERDMRRQATGRRHGC